MTDYDHEDECTTERVTISVKRTITYKKGFRKEAIREAKRLAKECSLFSARFSIEEE